MPLFNVEMRPKRDEAEGNDEREEPREQAPRGRSKPATDPDERGGAALPALIAGAGAALVLLAAASVFIIRTFGPDASGGQVAGTSSQVAVDPPAATARPPMQALQAAGVPPINPDFPRNAVIAQVNGEPYTMAQLEVAVRLARALGTLAGDPVPNYDDPAGMIRFQVNILRRQIDVMLFEQAARSSGTLAQMPNIPAEELVADFLNRTGASQQQLTDALQANGVTVPQLHEFLQTTQIVDFFIQSELMTDRQPEERDAVAAAWIDQQWSTQPIDIRFYDPESIP